MGIPSYFSHVVRNHRNTITEVNTQNKIDNLYLDSNSIIYDSVHATPYDKSQGYEKKIMQLVCNKIDEYVKTINPSQRLMIAFDGVAPIAKLNQQRDRRYKSWVQSNMIPTSSWNTCAITPGTYFMSQLSKYIKAQYSMSNFTKRMKTKMKIKLKHIVISTSDEPGEGEHKIYDYIRTHSEYHKNTKTAIYGLDADLIMLTLNHLHIAPNMYLYRETPHFIKSIDKTLMPNKNYVLDIPFFAKYLHNELSQSMSNRSNIVKDYVFLCFFLGNDFLPHFPSLNIRTSGIEIIQEAYKKCARKSDFFLIDENNKIHWRNLKQLVIELSNMEYDNLLDEYDIRETRYSKPMKPRPDDNPAEFRLLNLPIREREIEVYINPDEEGWEWRYYKSLFDIEVTEELKKQICINYLEGLEWTLAYYTNGCKNWEWRYKYHYPPLLKDLVKYIPYFNTDFIVVKDKDPVSPLVQLSYVLPRAYLNLLPQKTQIKLMKDRPEWYKSETRFLWAFCRYFWEAHAILPEINLKDLKKMIHG